MEINTSTAALTRDGYFELGLNPPGSNKKDIASLITYTKESVLRYRANSAQDLIDDTSVLLNMIRHHLTFQVPRLRILEEYYLGNNPGIMEGQRRKDEEKSDHRARHPFASIISDFINAHVLGNKVKIESQDEDLIKLVTEFNDANDIHSHNLEIGTDQNNAGRAFELLVNVPVGENKDKVKIYRLEPTEVFMVHDKTVAAKVIAAVRYYKTEGFKNEGRFDIEVYDFEKRTTFHNVDITRKTIRKQETDIEPHKFKGVPIVEYRSNRYKQGVFEKQIPLIDLYDEGQSDTANFMTDFNDAVLKIEGVYENARDPATFKTMKDMNVLALIPEMDESGRPIHGTTEYLTKSYDVNGVEAYKTRIKDDIFNTASVPDLNDNKFSGNQSGEALKYKLFGLEQKREDKEKYFSKGLRVRYRLLANLKKSVFEYRGDGLDLAFKFTPKLPEAHLADLKTFVEAGGQVSQATKISLLPFIDDVDKELEELDKEKSKTVKAYLKDGFHNHSHEVNTDGQAEN